MTNEPSNHIDPIVSWTDEATITLEPASPSNAGTSERSRSLCPGMNATPILWSGANLSGGKRLQTMEGLWVGQASQERACQLSRPDARKQKDAPTLAAKSYTTHHLSVGAGRCVALSNTHML